VFDPDGSQLPARQPHEPLVADAADHHRLSQFEDRLLIFPIYRFRH